MDLKTSKSSSNSIIRVPKQSPDTQNQHLDSFNSLLKTIFCGCSAGFANVLISYPFDTLKVRMQITHSSLTHSFNLLYRTEGPLSFFKGVKTQLYSQPFLVGLDFVGFEMGKRLLGVGIQEELTVK